MKRLLTILPILALIASGCNKEPYADFRISPNPAYVGEEVSFLNLSQNTVDSEWDTGDGNIASVDNLLYTYVDPGTYYGELRAYGKKGDVSRASFEIDVIGSELRIIVEDVDVEDLFVEGASVVLFDNLQDWDDANYDNMVAEGFTNRYGEVTFSNLSYTHYYVDVLWLPQGANEGYANWLLGIEDVYWIETQMPAGQNDNTFVAYVEWLIFDDAAKAARKEGMRAVPKDVSKVKRKNNLQREQKENKIVREKAVE